jgi:hypothetical protein
MKGQASWVHQAGALLATICKYPFALLTHCLRGTIIGYKQASALQLLKEEQRQVLRAFAKAGREVDRIELLYIEASAVGISPPDMEKELHAAISEVERLAEECRKAGVLEEQIGVFRLSSYNYWWWELFHIGGYR